MQIKTTEGDREVASKGVAGTALGLGIAGTVGLLNQLSSGIASYCYKTLIYNRQKHKSMLF